MKQLILYICFAGLCSSGLAQTVPDSSAVKQADTVRGNSPDTIMGPSRLRDTSLLHAVTVYGRKAAVKPTLDGFIYNAENDVSIAAGSAIDVLRRIPMVTIGMDGAPRIQGSNNIRVYIDNKPSDMYASSVADALRQIAAEDIASVEVITQPSARFDAEGTDAVINIITKKNRYNGVNGRLNMVVGNRTLQAGSSVKWRKKNIILGIEGNWYRYNNTLRTLLERTSFAGNLLQQQTDKRSVWNTYIANAMVTWLIDSLHTLTAGYRYRYGGDRVVSMQYVMYSLKDSVADLTRQINNQFDMGVHTINATYAGTSRNKKRELNLMGFHFFTQEHPWYDLQQRQHAKVNHMEKNDTRTSNREWSMQADLVQSFGKTSKLETGGKWVWRQSRSHNVTELFNFMQDDYLFDPIRSSQFDYDRSLWAGYFNYLYIVKSWSIRIGLRYELTTLYAHFKDTALRLPDYNNWLPNFLISKMLTENHTVKLSYASKITRPYLYILNPTINYIDSFNIEYGNPVLEPEIVHNGQLVYQYNKNKLLAGVTLFVDYRVHAIEQVRYLKEGISATTWSNIGTHLGYGASANFSFDGNRHMSGGAGVTAKYVTLKSPALQLVNSGWMTQANARLSYRFKKSLQAEVTVQYYPSSIRLQGRSGDWFFYSLSVNKKWWNDKLQASWSMENFFTRYQHSIEVLQAAEFYQTITNRYPVQFCKLGLTFRFGKKEIREPVRKGGEGEE